MDSYISLPSVCAPLSSQTLSTEILGGGTLLKFKYAALKSKLPLILLQDLKNEKYLARGQCSEVVSATCNHGAVAVKRIVNDKDPGTEEWNSTATLSKVNSKISQLQKDIEVCSHPGLIKSGVIPLLVGYGAQDGLPFLAMELATAGSLVRLLYTEQSWGTRLSILKQVAAAVKVLHENGIQHGDLKLENVLVYEPARGKYVAKLSDFSHAHYPQQTGQGKAHTTYYGTWPFIPNEVWTGKSPQVTENCDVWAFGLVIWRVCQYRNDDCTDLLSFIPSHDKELDECEIVELERRWVHALDKMNIMLLNSGTILPSRRQDIASLFRLCVSLSPLERTSSARMAATLESLDEAESSSDSDGSLASSEHKVLDVGRAFKRLDVQTAARPADQYGEKDTVGKTPWETWPAVQPHFPALLMLKDRSSWRTQVEFLAELKRNESEGSETDQSIRKVLVNICQAYGYGCIKDARPLETMVKAEAKSMMERDRIKVTREYDVDAETSEIPALRCADQMIKEVARVGGETGQREMSEYSAFFRHILDSRSNVKESIGSTLLWSAVRHGFSYAAIGFLAVEDVNDADYVYGSTALHVLFNLPEEHIARVGSALVRRGANLQAVSRGQPFVCSKTMVSLEGTPLLWAVKSGSLSTVAFLVSEGADPLHKSGTLASPLETAISLYQPEIVKILLSYSSFTGMKSPEYLNPQSPDEMDQTAQAILMGFNASIEVEHERMTMHGTAAENKAESTLRAVLRFWPAPDQEILLEMLLQLNVSKMYEGQLWQATTLLPYLLDVILRIRSRISQRPLPSERISVFLNGLVRLWEIDGVNCERVLDSILQQYQPLLHPNVVDSKGRTPLHYAAIYNAAPLVPILLRHGAQIEALDHDGSSPLLLAARMASVESFEELLDSGAEISCNGVSALHLAALPQTRYSLVPYMLHWSRHRSKLCAPRVLEGVHPGLGMTPLGLSVMATQSEAVDALMRAGANCRAALALPGYPIVLSVREFATVTYYKPGIKSGTATDQRDGAIDPEDMIRVSKDILRNFYSKCEDSNYEEEGVVGFTTPGTRFTYHVRDTRLEENFEAEWVSLDVLPERTWKQGVSMWDVDVQLDLRPGEDIKRRTMSIRAPF